jgi:hypothetical protein
VLQFSLVFADGDELVSGNSSVSSTTEIRCVLIYRWLIIHFCSLWIPPQTLNVKAATRAEFTMVEKIDMILVKSDYDVGITG